MHMVTLKDKRFVSLFIFSVAVAVIVSLFPQNDANSLKIQKEKFARPGVMNWSTRTYSPEPPLTDNRTCTNSVINVIVLIDRNEEIADRDARDTHIPAFSNDTQQIVNNFVDANNDGVDDNNPTVVRYTTEASMKRGYIHTMAVTAYESNLRNTKVNFFTFAVATNVVPQYEVDPSAPAGTFTPVMNTRDWNSDGLVDNVPVTEITSNDIKQIDSLQSIGNIYYKKTGDPAEKSSSPTDISRGYGTTDSPNGVGRTNWANAYAFAANMTSARYNTPGNTDDIDIVLAFWGTNPDQNNGYNQIKDTLTSNDFGTFSDTNFGHGGLNNTNAFITQPASSVSRSLRYKPERESDVWMAANVVEALRTGNAVADLSNDDPGYSTPPGLSQVRNGVQLDTFLGGRFPSYNVANKVFGQSRYLTAPDFRKQFTGYRENGWRKELCEGAPPGTPGYDNNPIIEDLSLEVNGLEGSPINEGESKTVQVTVRNSTRQIDKPGYKDVNFALEILGCTPVGHTSGSQITMSSGTPEKTFDCIVTASIGGGPTLTVSAKIPATTVNAAIHSPTTTIIEMTTDATDSETTTVNPANYPA